MIPIDVLTASAQGLLMAIGKHPTHSYDDVELRATRNGSSIVLFLSRGSASEQRLLFEEDGWVCEICETERDGRTDGPGALSLWTALRARHAAARQATARLVRRVAAQRLASATVWQEARTARREAFLARAAR